MNIEYMSPLARKIISSEEFSEAVLGIVAEGKRLEIDNDDELHNSLVASGAIAAIGMTQAYFLDSSMQALKHSRAAVKQIDTAALCITESEGIAAVARVREYFATSIELHAKVLYEAFISRTHATIGLERIHMEATTDISKYSRFDLQHIGFSAYQKLPAYFNAWSMLESKGVLEKMPCKCASCLLGKHAGDSEATTLSARIKEARGLDGVFCEFGSFVLTEHRNQLKAIGADADTEPAHAYSESEAVDAASSAIASWRGRSKK